MHTAHCTDSVRLNWSNKYIYLINYADLSISMSVPACAFHGVAFNIAKATSAVKSSNARTRAHSNIFMGFKSDINTIAHCASTEYTYTMLLYIAVSFEVK